MKSTIFNIQGMNCDGCAQKISARLSQQAGVRAVDVSFGERQARVLYEPGQTTEQTLADMVQQLGFRVIDTKPA